MADATCIHITGGDDLSSHHLEPKPLQELERCWQQGLEISRSLWDRQSLLVHLDVEYVNFDSPAAVYPEPEQAFELQQPVDNTIRSLLLGFGITPLHLLSGRGHHFVWRVDRCSNAFLQLAGFGRVPHSLRKFYERPH